MFSWLKRWRRPTERGGATPGTPPTIVVRYLAPDETELPSLAGATQRLEIEQVTPELVETRYYGLSPDRLLKLTREGTDPAGQPYSSRVSYWPWGQEAVRVTTSFEQGLRCVEYQSFFENGDLKLRKKVVGNRVMEKFAYAPPTDRYVYVEQMPVYPGGHQQLLKDIQRAVKYPAQARRNGEEGKVFVGFEVRPDGLMANISLKTGVTPALNAAALAAVESVSQQRWRPGFQNQRAVPVTFTVPITFRLQ